LTQLFAMVVLCCAVENGDAHLKNFAVLYEHTEGLVQLAPVYDIIATTPVEGASGDIREYIVEHRDFARAGEHLIATFERGLQRSIA
jgi:serine/threonine protein kinase HipA of HipAB toxin-antitoxin module